MFIAERTAKINAARLRMAMDNGGEPIFSPRPASYRTTARTITYVIIRRIVLLCAANSLTPSF
jgi:hypothetical protein